jgi:hypothetical protein
LNRDLLRLLLLFFLAWLLVLSGKVRATEQKHTVGVVPQFEQCKLYAAWRPILEVRVLPAEIPMEQAVAASANENDIIRERGLENYCISE